MRSRTARWTFGAMAWIALVAAALVIFQTESRILASTASLRSIDRLAHEAADALVDARVAQEAYVAQGQGIDFWMPKNAVSAERAAAALAALDQAASSTVAHDALAQAKAALSESTNIDARARDYANAGQPLMAGDVIFTEGGPAVASVAQLIETARIAEQQASYDDELAGRKLEALAAAGAGVFAGLTVLILAPGS
ncbi:MAG TPA: hypothetical protein VNZ26_03350, partial [Vicinamibacterales bacterium]|nr:hypothetical protein [Vicinamibacterales bacterium]